MPISYGDLQWAAINIRRPTVGDAAQLSATITNLIEQSKAQVAAGKPAGTVLFLSTKLDCRGDRVAQDAAVNPYFQRAVAMIYDALDAVDLSGASQERPIIAAGLAGMRSTRYVEFSTGRQPSPVQKCHLNACVYDTKTWEQAAAFALDTNPRVRRWVKNDHLGFVVPYRKDGIRRNYLPDFIVELFDAQFLVVEIKGQLGDAEIKAAAAQRWCAAVNNDGRFGQWTYHLVRHPGDLGKILDQQPAVSKQAAA